MKMLRSQSALLVLLITLVLVLTGCTPEKEHTVIVEDTATVCRFALVAKDTTNPYMKYMYSGFKNACEALGAEALLVGPQTLSSEAQKECIRVLIEQDIDAIAVAANDKSVLSEVLTLAIEKGIQIVSLDSNVNVDNRMVHIQQAAPDTLGRVLIQAAREMIGGEGQIAILTTTKNAPNQSLWVSWMLHEIEENPKTYAKIELVEVACGMDEYEPSRVETLRLLQEYPDLDIIIAPTTVGIRAAAEVIHEEGADVLITGLGLPSDMSEYILDGTCPWVYLWNPIDVGYIAAMACDALVAGEITGQVGEILRAEQLGDKRITESVDGGTEIVVGNPYMFDSGNIAVWREIF